MNRKTALAALAFLPLTLTGCGITETATGGGVHPTVAAEDQWEDETTAPADSGDHAEVPGTATTSTGVKITVKRLGSSTLSEVGAADDCVEGDPVRVFKVRVVNGSDQSLATSEEIVTDASYTDKDGDDQTASEVFDSKDYAKYDSDGFSDTPTLAPGRSTTTNVGFCVPNKKSTLVIGFTVYQDGEDTATALFTS